MKLLSKTFALYRDLPRPIYILFLAQVVNSLGHFVLPFLTLFLTVRIGLPADKAGLFLFLSTMSFVPGSLLGGKLADHIGRKKLMVISEILGAAMFIPCAFLGDSLLVPFFIIFANLFFGAAIPCFRAITADLSVQETRKPAFSLLYLGHNIGFAVGPMIAGFLFNRYMMWIFLGDAITTLLSVVLVILYVPETIPAIADHKKYEDKNNTEKAVDGNIFKALGSRPFLVGFIVITFFLSLLYSQFTFGLPMQVNEVFGEVGPRLFGFVMTANALVVIFLTTPIITLTKNMKPIVSVALGGFLYSIGFGVLYFLIEVPALELFSLYLVSTVIWTIGEVLTATNINVYIANHTPVSHRGRFSSLLPVISDAGFALSPPIFGMLIESVSLRAIWPIVGFLGLLTGVAYLLLARRERRGLEAV
jgi:MFS family permease